MSVMLAQQLPPLPKFSGEMNDGDHGVDTFEEWLERFELMATTLSWSSQTRLVNLITRLHGQAYSFFRSCTVEQRTNYYLLVAELRKRFTPVRLPAIQSSLFHDRKQDISESVDYYAQELRTLFHRAYPSVYQGTKEADTLGQTVLVNQFVAGLLPEIKSKIVGCEGDFNRLLAKARFEEAKLRDLGPPKLAPVPPQSPVTQGERFGRKPVFMPRLQLSGTRSSIGPRCYNCGSPSHLIRQCPYSLKNRPSETPAQNKVGKASIENRNNFNIGKSDNTVSSITSDEKSEDNSNGKQENISSELNKITVTMHGISSIGSVQLGPILTTFVEVEGVTIEALLDTGSPVTIIELESLLQILAKQRDPDQTPTEWRAAVEARLEPTTVVLQNYSGDKLQVVRQIQVTMNRSGYSTKALIQVQRGAPAKLLIGTDLLSKLGYLFVQASQTGKDSDMLDNDVSVSENKRGVNVVPQEIGQGIESDGEVKSISMESEGNGILLHNAECDEDGSRSGAVCLIQATRIPARHQKLVRVEVRGVLVDQQYVTMFEPNNDKLEDSYLSAPEALVCFDANNKGTLVLENHGCEPVYLEPGQELGQLERVALHMAGNTDNNSSNPSVNSVVTSSLDKQNEIVLVQEKQKRLLKLFELLKLNESGLATGELDSLKELVSEYSDIFALDPVELGCTDLITHSIDTGDSPPIRQPLRRIPFALHNKMEELVQKMLEQGVIQHSNSPWASPVVLVEKKDGSYRFCVDYRRLNAVTKMDVFPLPRVDDILDMLAHTHFFSTLDLAAGYWQVQMDGRSKEKTAFSTHSGHYEFQVMPFGLCNGPATFQRLMETVLVGLSRNCCMVYLDDVLVVGRSFVEHLDNLRKVFERFRDANLKLKPEKCCLAGSEVVYLGYVVSKKGVSADSNKIKAVQSFPQPHDLSSLRSFLGFASYYRRFVPCFSKIADPLYALTRKNTEFSWGQAQTKAFQQLKQSLTQAPVLAFPNFGNEFMLETDASGVGLGAILTQKQEDGTVRPIAYASRTLQSHEKRYSATELEALGIVWAVKHFRHYLYGHRCHVYSDHEPLKSLLNTPHPSGKLARWGLALQEVDLTIHYRPGKSNVCADSLSRCPLDQPDICVEDSVAGANKGEKSESLDVGEDFVGEENSLDKQSEHLIIAAVGQESEEQRIGSRQREDPYLKEIIDYQEGDILPSDDKKARELLMSRSQYHLMEGVLYYVETDKTLHLIPPESDRRRLFEEVHSGTFGAHLRDAKVHGELSKHYWWPKMRSDISKWCQSCLVCATRYPGRAVHPPLTPIPVEGPFHRVGVDVIQFITSHDGNRYAVVFTDYLTKWPEVFATKDQTALTIAKLFVQEIICRHGVPCQLLSDRGPAFLSYLMTEICGLLGVNKINTTAYHPQTNGLTERFNRTLTDMLAKKVEQSGKDWDNHLPFVLFAYRASIQESVKESPFYLLYGRDPRLPTTLNMDGASGQEVDVDTYKGEMTVKMNEAWELARSSIKKAQRTQKNYYDQQSKPPKFKVGDRVLVYMPAAKACKAYKFARPFHGPYRIVAQDGTGVVIHPVDKPQAEPIRVAYDRVRHCSELLSDKFWPTRAANSRSRHNKKPLSITPVTEEISSMTEQQTGSERISNATHDNSDDSPYDSVVNNRNWTNSQVDHHQQQAISSTRGLHEEANPWKNRLRPRRPDGVI